MVYRSKLEIRADILGVAKDGAKKTDILYQANLSYKVLKKYLHDLLEGGMLHIDRYSGKFFTTYRGEKYRKEILKLEKRHKRLLKRKEELDKEKDVFLVNLGFK